MKRGTKLFGEASLDYEGHFLKGDNNEEPISYSAHLSRDVHKCRCAWGIATQISTKKIKGCCRFQATGEFDKQLCCFLLLLDS